MPLTRRYQPTHSPLDRTLIGMDFSPLVPPNAKLINPALAIWRNWPGDVVPADADWTIDPNVGVMARGRYVFTRVSGGQEGVDYQFRWRADDTIGNTWERTALLLVAVTS